VGQGLERVVTRFDPRLLERVANIQVVQRQPAAPKAKKGSYAADLMFVSPAIV